MAYISIESLFEKFLECTEICTDTRKIKKDALFFALKGPNFNANALAQKAIELGAKFAVVDEAELATSSKMLLVEDGLTALQNLAKYYRSTWTIPVISLTGSNGKTTSKELINSVLSTKFKTHATAGNLNNHIGVPLTLLAKPQDAQIAIIEMGANHQQEIAMLSEIAQPNFGLITNIGKAHLEGFGGLAGVRKGKGELYDYLAKTKGTVFINGQNETLVAMAAERKFTEKIAYQQANSFLEISAESTQPLVQIKLSNGTVLESHLPGEYNFENMVNAIAIGKYFGIETDTAIQAVCAYNPTNNRSQWMEKGTNQILMDAYNANPSSMSAAISNFNESVNTAKMVILGDMFELGDEAEIEHENLGLLLKNCNIDIILLAGEHFKAALKHLPKAYYFPDKFGLHNWLQDNPIHNHHILIKGSRGMGLESCLPFL